MNYIITLPGEIERRVRAHLFQNELEQGAFLFAQIKQETAQTILEVAEVYLVPPDGWQLQMDVHLEMKDEERAKIMRLARQKNLALVDCHSHPGSFNKVWFSTSDRYGISEFALYAKWKLSGKPYAAMVWAESSIDAVVWDGSFRAALPVAQVTVIDDQARILIPEGSWFSRALGQRQVNRYG